jgi:hypothetical protein
MQAMKPGVSGEIPSQRGTVKINLGKYSKAIAGVLGQALSYASLYYGGNHYVAMATGIASAMGIWAVPNAKDPEVK